jgi:hypothetical protein
MRTPVKLSDLIDALGLEATSARSELQKEVTGGYAGDLLSDVIANGREGNVWVTLQAHQNIVAVAVMKDLAGIILVGGRNPEGDTLERAEAENVPIMVSKLPTFELIGRLYGLGLKGTSVESATGSEEKSTDKPVSDTE